MGNKKTKEDFIKQARKVHGDKYDYSKVKYVNSATKICIICPEHGEFWQRPNDHIRRNGCPTCGLEKNRKNQTSSTDEFIKKARNVHGNKYDYNKVEYVNTHTKVCIICPKHGEFWQRPSAHHAKGQGCPKCGHNATDKRFRSSKEGFIKKARSKHRDKYDYSNIEYVNGTTKVCIKCPKHGEFWQTPNSHLSGSGCPTCSFEKKCKSQTSSKSDFIKKAHSKHGNKYDYSKVDYVNCDTKVCIICPEHGEFWQTPCKHTEGCGCPNCGFEKIRESLSSSKEEFIKNARKAHGDKYDYSKVEYNGSNIKLQIICHKHGEFWQTPSIHTRGCGCPKCNLSHLERSVMNYLDEHGITYDYQKRFDWLGLQSLDFYLPDYNIGIECQGLQHFESIDYFGGKEGLNECKKRDKYKFKKCQKHGIKVLYYSNFGIEYPYDVFEDVDLLFEEIKNIQVKNK